MTSASIRESAQLPMGQIYATAREQVTLVTGVRLTLMSAPKILPAPSMPSVTTMMEATVACATRGLKGPIVPTLTNACKTLVLNIKLAKILSGVFNAHANQVPQVNILK